MKLLFYGRRKDNCGPDNANRSLAESLGSCFVRPESRNPVWELVQALGLLLRCRCVVVSGISRKGCALFAAARCLDVRRVYWMHGCAAREVRYEKPKSRDAVRLERYLMKNADLLLPVSRSFRDWLKEEYPHYAGKMKYLHNGVDRPESFSEGKKIPGTVAAAGGSSPVKNNGPVIRAVDGLGEKVRLTLCGPVVPGSLPESPCLHCPGQLPREDFRKLLAETELFVVNSRFETFSLAAVEALQLGCSLLLTKEAGVGEWLPLLPCDVVEDPEDEEELREKIAYLLAHPNNRRLLSALDWEAHSWQKTAKALEETCWALLKETWK